MNKIKSAIVAVIAVVLTLSTAGLALATNESNPNEVAYWQNLYPDVTCIKHNEQPDFVVVGSGVSVLIVKGGSVGDGNAVYLNPVAGGQYFAPLNGGGNVPTVSHWIECKPSYEETTTTVGETTTTVAETTTTVAETTTTLPSTTSTLPSTTSTVVVTTTEPSVTTEAPTVTTEAPVTTVVDVTAAPIVSTDIPPVAPAAPTELPVTGSDTGVIALGALFLLTLGSVLLYLRRRPRLN